MEYKLLLILLLGSGGLCSGVEQGLKVTMVGNSNKIEKVGSNTSLTCSLDQGLSIVLTHIVNWVHVPIDDQNQRSPDSRRETILTNLQTLTDQATPDLYKIAVEYGPNYCRFQLTLKKIQPSNDGIYICRVIDKTNQKITEVTGEIIVVNDVESVSMQFDGEESITGVSDVAVQREEGSYGVSCTAFGFNPDARIRLYLGDEELQTAGTHTLIDWDASKKAGARRYSATTTATKVNLESQHSGQSLKCSAHADFDGATTVTASVPLSVIAFEPEITCEQNVSAKVGDNYVKITCLVKHVNIDIKSVSWEIGKTGERIVPGESSHNYHEVILKEGSNQTYVTLDLFQVDDSHFDTFYYLDVFTKNGNYRQTAALIKKEADPNSSAKTSVALLVSLLCLIISAITCC